MTAVSTRVLAILLSLSMLPAMAELPDDPLGSVMWPSMAERYFPGEVIIDPAVQVLAPASAENPMEVPVTVDASALRGVQKIVAVADLNPIQLILNVEPQQALAFIGFRVKLQQATPVHVGVLTDDGVWHVNGVYIDAAGGGCTAPASVHGTANWMDTLGITRVHSVLDTRNQARLTLRMRHPMDTGLAPGIPAFYMSEIIVNDAAGQAVARLELFEPISENPTLTLKAHTAPGNDGWQVHARDTEGNRYDFHIDSAS